MFKQKNYSNKNKQGPPQEKGGKEEIRKTTEEETECKSQQRGEGRTKKGGERPERKMKKQHKGERCNKKERYNKNTEE